MKFILLLSAVLFLSSCSGTKKAIETSPQLPKKIAVVTQVPNTDDTPSIPKVPQQPEPPKNEELESKNEKNQNKELETIEEAPIIEDEVIFEYFKHTTWNELLSNNVSEGGNVDYFGFKRGSQKLRLYIKSLALNLPTSEWSKNDKLAYWINAYNALTVDLIIRNYPLKSIKDIKDPWNQRLWKLGKKWYNLNDIEHQILRKMDEPRIHFAIVCASESCPKLQNKAFVANNLEKQLANVTRGFLADTSKNKLSKNTIELSKIFKWFKKDFEGNGSLINFLNQYSDVSISSSAKKSYKNYSWDLNK